MFKVKFVGGESMSNPASLYLYTTPQRRRAISRDVIAAVKNGGIRPYHEISSDCEIKLRHLPIRREGSVYHTASHIMAQAVKRLYPDAKLTIGPAIEDGFYYDIDRDEPFTQETRKSRRKCRR